MRYRIGRTTTIGTTEHLCIEMEITPGNWSRMEARDAIRLALERLHRVPEVEPRSKVLDALRNSKGSDAIMDQVLDEAIAEIERLERKVSELRAGILNRRGDDLCWIKDHDAMRASPLPREEMLESCRRYVDQLLVERPSLCVGQMTIAQLEQRVVELETALEDRRAGDQDLLARLRATQCCDPVIDGMIGAVIERLHGSLDNDERIRDDRGADGAILQP